MEFYSSVIYYTAVFSVIYYILYGLCQANCIAFSLVITLE